MRRFTRVIVVTLGCVSLVVGISFVSQKNVSGAPNSAPVTVTNTPLPTIVANTPLPVSGNVNVTNAFLPVTGNINVTNASLPVTGTVTANINSLPNVNATITNPNLSALITNPANNPVITQDNDNAARSSFAAQVGCNFSIDHCSINPLYLVPVGKIAVLTTISGLCALRPGDALLDADLTVVTPVDPSTDQQIFNDVYITPGAGTAIFGFQVIIFTQSLNVFAWPSPNTPRIVQNPGIVKVLFTATADETNSGASCTVNLIGHLVSEPQIP